VNDAPLTPDPERLVDSITAVQADLFDSVRLDVGPLTDNPFAPFAAADDETTRDALKPVVIALLGGGAKQRLGVPDLEPVVHLVLTCLILGLAIGHDYATREAAS
jgi:hypothetical protein